MSFAGDFHVFARIDLEIHRVEHHELENGDGGQLNILSDTSGDGQRAGDAFRICGDLEGVQRSV